MLFQLSRLSATVLALGMVSLSAQAALDADTVAEVNDKKISKTEFDRRYKDSLKIFKFTAPTKANVLNDIINFEVAVEEAKRRGLDKKPEYKERMDAVLYQALVEEALTEKFAKAVEVSDADARAYCERNPEIRTSHIFVQLAADAMKESEKNATATINKALKDLAAGQKFEKVANTYSEGYAKDAGGDIGFQAKDKLDPAYYAAAKKLGVGQYTKAAVRSQFGLHVIKLTGVKDCKNINIPEYQRMVYDEKRAKIFDDYLRGLRSKAKVSINQSAVQE